MEKQKDNSAANAVLSRKERFCFATGDFAYNCVFYWVTSYLMIFYTDVFLIPASAVSVLMLVVRFYDAINDPIIGSLMDRTKSKMGRYRPWIIVGGLGLVVTGLLMFWAHPAWGGNAKLVYMYVTYMLVVTFSTIFYMAYMALTGCITSNALERAKASSWRMIASYGAMLVVGYAAPYMIAYFGSESAVEGYLVSVLICSAVAVPLFIMTGMGTRERITGQIDGKTQRIPMKQQWKALVSNKPMLILLICMAAHGVQMNGRLSIATYYCMYVGSGTGVLAVFNLLNSLACVIGCFLAPWIFKITGHKGKASAGILFVCALSMFGQYFTTVPGVLFYLLTVIVGLCYGCFSSLMFSMIPDAVDLSQSKEGVRLDGFFNAIASFGFKCGGAVGTSIIGLVLARTGYVANQAQTDTCLQAIRLLMSALPGMFCLIAGLFLLGYKISRKKHDEIINELTEKNMLA